MARAVRFLKPERELIQRYAQSIVDCPTAIPKGVVKAAQGIVAKLAESEAPQDKSRSHLSVQEAISLFQGVLGRRLIIPPNGASLIYIQMSKRLKSLGLDKDQCRIAAEEAGRQWQGNIKAQSIINQAERLLQDAESEPLVTERERIDAGFDAYAETMGL